MARNMYGATSADFTIASGGRVISGAVLTLWTARTGGTQITDLLDVDSGGLHHGHVRGRRVGRLLRAELRQDRALGRLRSGSRVAIRPTDITGDPPVMSIGTVGTGTAAASLTGTSEAPVLNLTLPSAGANGVDTAAIQDSAVTSAKIADNAVTDDKIASGVTFTVGADPARQPEGRRGVGRHVLTPITVIRKWDGTSWLVWIVTDATVPSIGDAAWGGYMAGIIDTTKGWGHRRHGPVAGRPAIPADRQPEVD